MPKNEATTVPKAVQNQLARLFGERSAEARKVKRTSAEWKRTLRKVLHEIDRYISANVDTDELHSMIIATGLCAADESLNEEHFWPGYAEGITRVLLALLGDYPDHRRRRTGARRQGHYRLDLRRRVCYIQSVDQRFRTLLAAGVFKLPRLSRPPQEVRNEFLGQFGTRATLREFLEWYKKEFPADYTAVFS
jgi:hypothetical protein